MNRFVFKSRWIAAGFAALTLVSVYLVVGEEGDETVLTRMQGSLADQKGDLDAAVANLESKPGQPQIADYVSDPEGGFTPDDELIDSATGLDPVGMDTQPETGFDAFDAADFDGNAGEEDTGLSRSPPSPPQSISAPPPPPPTPRDATVPQFINGIPVRVARPDDND